MKIQKFVLNAWKRLRLRWSRKCKTFVLLQTCDAAGIFYWVDRDLILKNISNKISEMTTISYKPWMPLASVVFLKTKII